MHNILYILFNGYINEIIDSEHVNVTALFSFIIIVEASGYFIFIGTHVTSGTPNITTQITSTCKIHYMLLKNTNRRKPDFVSFS